MSLYLAVFGKPRYLGLVDIGNLELGPGRWIVVDTLRGREMALLGGTLSREQEGKYRSACLEDASDEHTRGPEPMLQEIELVGAASASQIQEHGARRLDEEAVLTRSRQILRGHQFQMKLVDVEYTMDLKKLFFYFTSEQRVDFRAYVRDLAKEFRIRIEMRQIGVRDEAKTVRGVSPCGRPCCCSYWLHRFTPINIRMVKEQNLALNPTKISGICGRLMCCMFYEHSTYSELWKTLPSPGAKIKTTQGNYVLEGVDLHTEMVRVSFPEGGDTLIPISDFARFKETILRGETWQKEEKKEPDHHKIAFSRNWTPRILPDDPAKSDKKSRPEKISIEEHVIERAAEKPQPFQDAAIGQASQDSGRGEGRAAAKRRRHRRKDAQPDPRKQEKQATAQIVPENEQAVAQTNNAPARHQRRRGGKRGKKRHGSGDSGSSAAKKGDS